MATPLGSITRSFRSATAVTPNDSTDLSTKPTRALYIGTAGNISVDPVGGGSAVVLTNVPVGIIELAVDRVRSTSTTASGIVALY